MKKILRSSLNSRFFIGVFLSTLLTIYSSSCDDFVKVDSPRTELSRDVVFNDDSNALAAINGLYSNMISKGSGFASGGITLYAGLTSDELEYYNIGSAQGQFFKNSINSQNSLNEGLWSDAYNYIYHSNAILEGLSASTGLTQDTINQVQGGAEFVRAFVYFYLVNLYGDLPLVLTTDYVANAGLARSPETDIYTQIVVDLLSAQALLPDNFPDSGERIRPNKWAATALLARVYLYTEDWVKAEAQATAVINHSALFTLAGDLNDVFDINSPEAIWQMKPNLTGSGSNTSDGTNFIIVARNHKVAASNELMEAFEPDDLRNRKENWIGTFLSASDTLYFPYKYKVRSSTKIEEYYMMLRLTEQYLIRAEARAQQGKLSLAIADLDKIRKRAGLLLFQNTNPGIDQQGLLRAIEKERQTELFAEWGHRWFDLKRTKGIIAPIKSRADDILQIVKDTNWQSTDALFPIPFRDIQNDRRLKQNPGYY
jgi:hypothetical protein